ncbi:MAG: hypothetical protein II926_00155 [Bacteroidales bacterium]|nr:hypothetical protein [Bacteroidales bacterium]
MKQFFNIIIAIFFVSQSIYAQSYSLKFNLSDFDLIEEKGLVYIKASNGAYVLLEDTSLPALPYKIVNILLPNETELDNFTFSTNQTIFRNNIVLAKNPEVIPVSMLGEVKETNGSKTYSKEVYPEKNVVYSNTNIFRGYSYASFIVTPFVFNASQSALSFIDEIQITVSVKNSPYKIFHQYGEFDMISDILLNPKDVTLFYGENRKSTKTVTDTVTYLIITSPYLEKNFLPLKAWKIQKGIRTDIITVDDIMNNYPGTTIQLKIKHCIKDYYENHALKYVLMGGDEIVVPIQRCYRECGDSVEDNTIPCDLFYTCFDNQFDWNYNGNDTIGELFFDRVDLTPDVSISRIPVRSKNEVNTFISKTKKYEFYPALSNYVNRMLLTGMEIANTWDGKSDAHHWSEYIYSSYISPIWNGTKTKFYDTGTDYSGGSSYDLTASNLQTKLNLGYHFVHMATHGNNTAWKMETGSHYTSNNALTQTNMNPAVIITMACHTNAFDRADTCLSEAFLKNPNGGCIVYWGSSRQGWAKNLTSLSDYGASLNYNQTFFTKLFTETNTSFARITTEAKITYNGYLLGSYLWLQYSLNAIGDAELPIYTNNPSQFTNVSVTSTSTGITVNTGGISGCRIAVTSNGDFGASYFSVAENVSQASFSNLPTNYIVTITKKNYVPYRTTPDVYLQNCTINNDAYYYGNNIFVGKHVTTAVPQGNVYFTNNASITLDAENNVYLDSDVEVQTGVKLNIE